MTGARTVIRVQCIQRRGSSRYSTKVGRKYLHILFLVTEFVKRVTVSVVHDLHPKCGSSQTEVRGKR